MKTFLKFLSRNKVYTLVNVVGLSISLAFVIIIGLYSQMELGRDKWHEKADRIFSLSTEMDGIASEGSHYGMQHFLRSHFPEIENSCGLMYQEMDMQLPNQEKNTQRVMFADPSFFSLFDFPLSLGDRNMVFNSPEGIVLVEETARLLFGDTNPIGKTVTLNDSLHFTVTGVMPQLNHTIFQKCSAIVRFDIQKRMGNDYLFDPSMYSFGNTAVYLLANEGTDLKNKEKEMNELLSKNVWLFKPEATFGQSFARLVPLTSLYFSAYEYSPFTSRGDKSQSKLLFIAGIVILLFAVMNYINLTVAQSGFRMREMAMRRLLGSQRWQIVGRLVGESVLLCLLSLIIAVVIVWWLAPYANQLVKSSSSNMFWWIGSDVANIPIIQFNNIWNPKVLVLLFGSAVLLGIVAGIAPAYFTSSVKPIEIVRGTIRRKTKMFFSKIFIVIQHVITIVLIGVALTMWLQVNHLIHAPLGYNTERLMEVRLKSWEDENIKKLMQLYDEVKSLSCVEMATVGVGSPLMGGSNQTETYKGKTVSFQQFWNTKGWLDMLDIKVLRDYGTTSYNEYYKTKQKTYVTRKALQEENLPDDARSIQFGGETLQIDGVVADFHLKDILNTEQRPIVIREYESLQRGASLLMRYRGDKWEARRQVGECYRKVFGKDMMESQAFNFFEQQLQACYANQIRIQKLVTVFTFVALVVSLLGLVAMSTYYIQQRRQEIAVRKVFGSTNGEMLGRLLRQFLLYVLIAFVIATPIIYYIAGDWLTQFSYRIALSPWIFVASGLACFIISLLAVLVQSWRAANLNPIENIKTE